MSRTAATTMAKTHSTAEETCAELGLSFNELIDCINRGLINRPSRYIKGSPEWDKGPTWTRPSREGKVYLAGFGPYVKIGFTSAAKVEHRLAELQTGCPEKIEIFALIDGTCATEAALHRRFADLRTYGEWFRREGDLAAWISSGCR